MTTVQETITSLLTNAGLTVYPLSVPASSGSYPNVVYQMITNQQIRSHVGIEMERPRMQLSCHAKKFSECVATAQTVKTAMDLNRTNFKLATKENEFDARDVESGIYRIVLEYFVWV